MANSIKLRLSGGFHNSNPVNVVVNKDSYEDYKRGLIDMSDMFSKNQKMKLDKHFCGVSDCTCGSYMRADIEELKQ